MPGKTKNIRHSMRQYNGKMIKMSQCLRKTLEKSILKDYDECRNKNTKPVVYK